MAVPVDDHLLLRKGQGVLIDRQDDVILQRDRIDGICLCIRRDGRKGFFHIDEGSGCEIAAADEDRRRRIGARILREGLPHRSCLRSAHRTAFIHCRCLFFISVYHRHL